MGDWLVGWVGRWVCVCVGGGGGGGWVWVVGRVGLLIRGRVGLMCGSKAVSECPACVCGPSLPPLPNPTLHTPIPDSSPPLPLSPFFLLLLPHTQTAQYSTQIFSLAVLLSSMFVYNQVWAGRACDCVCVGGGGSGCVCVRNVRGHVLHGMLTS